MFRWSLQLEGSRHFLTQTQCLTNFKFCLYDNAQMASGSHAQDHFTLQYGAKILSQSKLLEISTNQNIFSFFDIGPAKGLLEISNLIFQCFEVETKQLFVIEKYSKAVLHRSSQPDPFVSVWQFNRGRPLPTLDQLLRAGAGLSSEIRCLRSLSHQMLQIIMDYRRHSQVHVGS